MKVSRTARHMASRLRRTSRLYLWRRAEGRLFWRDLPTEDMNGAPGESDALRDLSLAEALSSAPWAASEEAIRRRMDHGDVCQGICRNGEVVFVHWLTRSTCYVRGGDLLLHPGEATCYLYAVVAKASARGQGLFGHAQRQLLSQERQRGVHRIAAYIESDNEISQWAFSKFDYTRSPPLVSYRLCGVRVGHIIELGTLEVRRALANGFERRHYWI